MYFLNDITEDYEPKANLYFNLLALLFTLVDFLNMNYSLDLLSFLAFKLTID